MPKSTKKNSTKKTSTRKLSSAKPAKRATKAKPKAVTP